MPIDETIKATRCQIERYRDLYEKIKDLMGQVAADPTSNDAYEWALSNNKSVREMFDYAIHLAEAKLNAPFIELDSTEYEEAIKGEEIVESLS